MKKNIAISAFAVLAASAAHGQELRFMCYQDGNECDVWAEAFQTFEAENPGITVVVDVVPYQAILESLPVQLEVGEGPDLARVTDYGGLARFMLDVRPFVDDPDMIEARYGQSLAWARVGDNAPDGIYNIVDQLTATGGFANQTLFEQAGVEMPAPGASWAEWAEASVAVRDTTGVDFAMALDRTGHRFAAPAISFGAALFDDTGEALVIDDGFRAFAEQFVDWHENGVMARDVWAGAGGGTYQDAAAEFINANLVMYYSGSWQIGRFGRDIGDAFDWVATGGVCGPEACTGMPGGAGVVGFNHTEHPEAVGKLIGFVARDDVQAQVLAQTRNLPANAELQANGIDYQDVMPEVAAALTVFAASVPTFSDTAYALQGYQFNRAVFTSIPARLTQAIVGELPLDDALDRLHQDVADAIAEAR
ncbi:ABC transporter substrate-binding protein [Roseinatronobacter alkalisoli]|uniref:ABC transporter substrate-binding protein n=1 Tax=Roseinatronobacter alkalisoli TaxID=3028235 RepID=A0ABT5TCA0_9RHOB|nr:ABC transporter substrate-binding protein [Roseinatronobacter sp. HJB301]MDD7972746.1 ABC transporter substrate-binding protein [Roseinatronobacter sp. HJB301]